MRHVKYQISVITKRTGRYGDRTHDDRRISPTLLPTELTGHVDEQIKILLLDIS